LNKHIPHRGSPKAFFRRDSRSAVRLPWNPRRDKKQKYRTSARRSAVLLRVAD